jgi:peptidoglycan/xylan/chitin deacetylase (PgdA/CDA1 family)
MNFTTQARSWLIQAATLSRADALAFRLHQFSRPQALVVAVHETPASLRAQFHAQLEWASHHFTITNLETFAALWSGSADRPQPLKPLLLFTFDDGRESNYSIAAPLLESFGGRGVFFIVPAFADCRDEAQALTFYRTRINPDSSPLDEATEDWKPMNPAQIADLAERGHAIGNHTLRHEPLVGLSPEALEREIGESARILASWAKQPIEAFAWTFGWNQIDASAWREIQRYHRFCFSPCAGAIHARRDLPSLLWRREIEVRYSPAEQRFAYSGLLDLWWARRRSRLRHRLHPSSQ